MHDALRKFLKAVGEDPNRPGLKKTPERFEEALKFLTSGYQESLEKIVNGALYPAESHNLILVRDIEFYTLCEHHLLPFFGKAHIGYLPGKHVIGLSKIPRIIDMYARRLQTQERLGQQICDALERALKPKGVGVVLEAEHLCMKMRGVEKEGACIVTHHFRGAFEHGVSERGELLSAIVRGGLSSPLEYRYDGGQ